jgi:hypothetical protein
VPGPQGPRGATGPAGPKGSGAIALTENDITLTVKPGQNPLIRPQCPAGKHATGGGWVMIGQPAGVVVQISRPENDLSGWIFQALNTESIPRDVTAEVICA